MRSSLMFLGQFRSMFKRPEEEEEERKKVAPTAKKSSDAEIFLRSPRAQSFIKRWAAKKKEGKKIYTKRGVVSLLKSLFQIPGLSSDEAVLEEGEELLNMLGGMDGLTGFLMGWKAKSEGIIKGLKVIMGSK